MTDVKELVFKFRNAIDAAKDAREFDKDFSFHKFPRGCCGDTSDLLAQYLLNHGIKTKYVCGTYYCDEFENIQSHAWLLTDNQVMIDITGDQFKYDSIFLNYDKPVYIGRGDKFHELFEGEKRNIREARGLDALGSFAAPRLKELYQKITKYI